MIPWGTPIPIPQNENYGSLELSLIQTDTIQTSWIKRQSNFYKRVYTVLKHDIITVIGIVHIHQSEKKIACNLKTRSEYNWIRFFVQWKIDKVRC